MTEHKNHPSDHQQKPNKPWHQDWRTWTAVLLMLAAMVVYVFSVDESIGPGADETGTETPATAE